MFKHGMYFTQAILALLLVINVPMAHAALVQGIMTGVIAESAETRGEGKNIFGLDGAGLLGQSFLINFYYDTGLAPITRGGSASDGGRTFYGSNDPSLDWLGLSITVNNIKHDVIGERRYADVLDIYTDPFLSNTDHFQLAVGNNFVPFDGLSYRQQFLEISTSFKNNILESAFLPTSLISTEIERVYNSAAFRINEFDLDPITGELIYERYVNFNLDVQSIELAAVPIPPALLLFAPALLGFWGLRRKHQSTNY